MKAILKIYNILVLVLFILIFLVTLISSGCSPIEIKENDNFFKEGRTYQTSEEAILLFSAPQFVWQKPDDYDTEGVLYPIPYELTPLLAELRNKKELKYRGGSNVYNGLIIYVPKGTKFRVTKIYKLFPNCLEGNTVTFNIEFLGDFEKYRHACFAFRIAASETPETESTEI